MKITNESKPIFLEVLKEKNSNALKISLVDHENGGKALDIQCVNLTNTDRVIDVNGVNVIMDEETEKMLEHYTFDKDEETGGLKLIYTGPHSCGCGCDCNGDHDCDCDCDCDDCH